MEIVIILLLAIIIFLQLVLFFKKNNANTKDILDISDISEKLIALKAINESNGVNSSQNFKNQREEIINTMSTMQDIQTKNLNAIMFNQNEHLANINKTTQDLQQEIARILESSLSNLQTSNEEKLNQIQNVVNEKLDSTLNSRLDSSFKQIGDQLGQLYQSLGEISNLSSGVNTLNKTLSNVKTRGIWGEVQLQSILDQTMTISQYDINIATKKNSNDRVEFAIKIPDKNEKNDFIYLPIDSKMPSDIYNKIMEASEKSDTIAVNIACKELEARIKAEARTIRDKYLDPPNTTDFGIMFLPTEGLYSEALRINGLSEWCQNNCKIILTGPTTITALLNSLQIGFTNMSLSKKSKEVLKVLQAVKLQYTTLNELIDKTQKKMQEALNLNDQLKNRTSIINNKMSKIHTSDIESNIDFFIADESIEEELERN